MQSSVTPTVTASTGDVDGEISWLSQPPDFNEPPPEGIEDYYPVKVCKWAMVERARGFLPLERIALCHRKIAKGHAGVDVMRNGVGSWFKNLVQCGSVWVCPLCAQKVCQHRKVEVQQAIDYALKVGYGVSLVTITYRHGRQDNLQTSLDRHAKALRRLKSGRGYQGLQARYGVMGEIRALEVTHGLNGWHVHTHSIVFTQSPLTGHELVRYKRELFCRWYRACGDAGLALPMYRYGVDVRSAKYVAAYVTKWGFAHELTAANRKKARMGGRTPWQLLADATDDARDRLSAALFIEFADCFKGKRQLFWSRGLRDKLAVGVELTDQQVMALEPDERVEVLTIDEDTWALVLKAHARAKVLDVAMEGNYALAGYLNWLRDHVPMWDGRVLGARDDWG